MEGLDQTLGGYRSQGETAATMLDIARTADGIEPNLLVDANTDCIGA